MELGPWGSCPPAWPTLLPPMEACTSPKVLVLVLPWSKSFHVVYLKYHVICSAWLPSTFGKISLWGESRRKSTSFVKEIIRDVSLAQTSLPVHCQVPEREERALAEVWKISTKADPAPEESDPRAAETQQRGWRDVIPWGDHPAPWWQVDSQVPFIRGEGSHLSFSGSMCVPGAGLPPLPTMPWVPHQLEAHRGSDFFTRDHTSHPLRPRAPQWLTTSGSILLCIPCPV